MSSKKHSSIKNRQQKEPKRTEIVDNALKPGHIAILHFTFPVVLFGFFWNALVTFLFFSSLFLWFLSPDVLCFYLQGKEECTDAHRRAQTRTMRQTGGELRAILLGFFLYSVGLYRSRGVTCKLTRKTLTICEYVRRGVGEQQAEFAKVEHKQNAEEAAAGKADRRRKSEQKKRSVTKICFAIEQNQQQQQQIRKRKKKLKKRM